MKAMAIKEIITIPDPILRETCLPVADVDRDLNRLIDDMLETMYDAPGIGLAAPQVAVSRRLIVMDETAGEDKGGSDPIVMINPEIITSSEKRSTYDEGCLSIPEYFAEIERPASVLVKYIDREGKPAEMQCEGLLATIVQHEIDHLNGQLFIDYLSKLRRDRVIKKFAKLKKNVPTI